LKVAQAFINSARQIKERTMIDRFSIVEYELFML